MTISEIAMKEAISLEELYFLHTEDSAFEKYPHLYIGKGITIFCMDYDVSDKPKYISFQMYAASKEAFLNEYNITNDMNFGDIGERLKEDQFFGTRRNR